MVGGVPGAGPVGGGFDGGVGVIPGGVEPPVGGGVAGGGVAGGGVAGGAVGGGGGGGGVPPEPPHDVLFGTNNAPNPVNVGPLQFTRVPPQSCRVPV